MSVGRIASCASCAFLALAVFFRAARRGTMQVVAEILGDDAPRRRDRLGCEVDAVGACASVMQAAAPSPTSTLR